MSGRLAQNPREGGSGVNDKPLYQSAEADKWFVRYLSAIKQRDEARAEVERLREENDDIAKLHAAGVRIQASQAKRIAELERLLTTWKQES